MLCAFGSFASRSENARALSPCVYDDLLAYLCPCSPFTRTLQHFGVSYVALLPKTELSHKICGWKAMFQPDRMVVFFFFFHVEIRANGISAINTFRIFCSSTGGVTLFLKYRIWTDLINPVMCQLNSEVNRLIFAKEYLQKINTHSRQLCSIVLFSKMNQTTVQNSTDLFGVSDQYLELFFFVLFCNNDYCIVLRCILSYCIMLYSIVVYW